MLSRHNDTNSAGRKMLLRQLGLAAAVDKLSVNGGHRMRTSVLALRAVVLFLTLATGYGQDIDQILQQATQAAERGEHDRAIEKLTEAIKASPMTALPWYLR